MVAFDLDNNKIYFGGNGTWFGSSNPATGSNPAYTINTGTYTPIFRAYDTGSAFAVNFGQRAFAYTAPSGFKALVDTNLPAPVVAKPNTVMDVLTWTGNSVSGRSITGLNFNPDLVWIKSRSNSGIWNVWFDVLRGGAQLSSNQTDAELAAGSSVAGYVSAFNSNGFTVTTGTSDLGSVNFNNLTYVAWAWDAGSSTVTNTQGSITSQVRANASAGFSIVTYSGTGTTGTVGHGGLVNLDKGMIIVKTRTGASVANWMVYHGALGATKVLEGLNTTSAASTSSAAWNNTAPTSTVFTVGNESNVNGSGRTFVAYCFAPVDGYSSFGSYTGNGSADGPFVFCNFRPRWLMIKRSSGGANGWHIADAARSPDNLVNEYLYANTSDSEFTNGSIDFLSNGFKLRADAQTTNNSGVTYVYACFAESPFQYARAR